MKTMSKILLAMLVCAVFAAVQAQAAIDDSALSANSTYTVTIEKVNSDGTVTSGATSLGISTTGTTDADGILSFTLSDVPSNDTCNFLVITIKDGSGNTARQSVAPCPDNGSTMPMGITGISNHQTVALLDGFQSAGSDDPILAVFGNTVVRSTGISESDLQVLAPLMSEAISGSDPNSFVNYLKNNGVTDSQLATYRSAIVSELADANDGFSKVMKDAAAARATSPDEMRKTVGKAASKLIKVLIDAADAAGFSPDIPMEAQMAMGGVITPLIQAHQAEIDPAALASIDSTMSGAIDKLRSDKEINHYTDALSTLGATGADLTQFTNAATTMASSISSAFQTFQTVFDGSETAAEVQAAETTFQTATQNAFNTFITSVQADNTRITTLVNAINTILGPGSVQSSDFQTYDPSGNAINWPIMMVVATQWINNAVSQTGDPANTVSYTRDTVSPPLTDWFGECTHNGFFSKQDCENDGGTWGARSRTDFSAQGIPGSYASLFAIQEDMMIRGIIRDSAVQAAGSNMEDQMTAEKAYRNGLDSIAANISGTNPDGDPITDAEKDALILLMKTPQF